MLKSAFPSLLVIYTFHAPLVLTSSYTATSGTWAGTTWGQLCMDPTEFDVTCGWTILVESALELTNIIAHEGVPTRYDNGRRFHVDNEHWNGDEPTTTAIFCTSVTIQGPFGNTAPSLNVSWYCYCGASTGGLCLSPPSSATTAAATTPAVPATTPSLYATTVPSTTTAAAVTSVSSAPDGYGLFIRYPGQFYIAPANSATVQYRMQCFQECYHNTTCKGVNVGQTPPMCSFVTETFQSNRLMNTSSDCEFWLKQ